MKKFGLRAAAVGIALFATFPAGAQIWDGTWDLIHSDIRGQDGDLLGYASITGDAAWSGMSAFEEAWEWTDESWPNEVFYLDPGTTAASIPDSVIYENLEFGQGTKQPPASLSGYERLYRVELCTSNMSCGTAAYVIVDLETYDLQWFKAPGLGSYSRLPLTQNRTVWYHPVASPPSSTGVVPFIDNPVIP